MITRIITTDNILLALIVDHRDMDDEVRILGSTGDSLQALMMKRPAGYTVAKHTSKIIEKTTAKPGKALVVINGKMSVTICDRNGNEFGTHELTDGQCLFLIEGGYKIDMLKPTEFYEFKNGPFIEDKILL